MDDFIRLIRSAGKAYLDFNETIPRSFWEP